MKLYIITLIAILFSQTSIAQRYFGGDGDGYGSGGATNQQMLSPVVDPCANDTVAPVFSGCPEDIHTCSTVTAYVPPTVSDNCNLDTMTRTFTTGYAFTVGITTVTYHAVDESGNVDSCQFTMYRHPLPVADAGNDVTINSGDSVQLGGAPTALGGSPGYSYLWFPAEEMVDGTVANPVAFPSQTTDFTVFAIDTNGCAGTDMVNVTVESAFTQNGFGKGNWEKGNISIYPNPATDRLAVDMQLDNHRSLERVKVLLTDMSGRLIFYEEVSVKSQLNYEINVEKLQQGQYLLKVLHGQFSATELVTIAR